MYATRKVAYIQRVNNMELIMSNRTRRQNKALTTKTIRMLRALKHCNPSVRVLAISTIQREAGFKVTGR